MVYYMPNDGNVGCPALLDRNNTNFTLGINNELSNSYVIATFVLGALYFILTIWMLLEYFIVTWPHFVLPEILYTLQSFCQELFEDYSWLR